MWQGPGYHVILPGLTSLCSVRDVCTRPFLEALGLLVRDSGYLAIIIVLCLAFREPLSNLGFGRAKWWHVWAGVAAAVAFEVVWQLLAHVVHFPRSRGDVEFFRLQRHAGPFARVLFVLGIGVVSPLAQEAYFRAALLRLFGRYAATIGVLATSLVFGLWQWTAGPQTVFNAALFGIVASVLYLRTRSIVAPYAMHAVVNCYAVFVYTVL